ncbi:unnamed protein product [Prorocentrum cordatum]|uniref:CCHC-type domain-containing protein n=1 Tax=Prorocentrum cordatum TaxID=2364126 RepID=A0ABN9S7V6_9DINO|nr:unnamed protein product [Polarella glacialis]
MAADSGAAGVQMLDSRGVGKVPTFSGKREDFEDWIFPFESFCGLLGWTAGLDRSREAEEPLTVDDLGEQGVQVGRSLYHLLASTTKGTAQSIGKLCPRGDGFEAMRRLHKEYRPRLNEEHGQMLQQILTPLWWKDREGKERFTEVLIAWGELISRYERATGEQVTQNMKTSTIMAHAPEEVKVMLRSAQREVRSDVTQMRNCIFEAVIGQSGVVAKPPTANWGSNDMDVDAISKGKGKDGKDKCQICHKPSHAARDCFWRDKGKQKGDGKGRGAGAGSKGGKDAKGKGKDGYTFTGKCDYCHKTGHKKADCKKRIADEKAKGNAAIEQESADPKTVAKIEYAEYECEICDDDQLYCMAMKAEDPETECCGMELEETTFITLDTASDCHVGPTCFGEGCKKGEDRGPRLLDAQRKEIKIDSIATVPMAVADDCEQPELLKADFRLGDAVSKPILSLLEVMGKGAEFWLSAKTGMCMYPGGDLSKGIPLTRKNNTLGFNAKTFKTATEAKEFAASVNTNEQQEEAFAPTPGAAGSGAATAAPAAPAVAASDPARDGAAEGAGGERLARHPVLLREGQEIVLHPSSRVEDMRARLKEMGQPIYGRKDELWARLSDAERRPTAHHMKMKELERRHEESVQGGNETTKPHKTLTFDQKDTGKAQITLDFCYLKTNGDWTEIGEVEPPAADIFATTLVMADRDTLMFNAVSMPTKAVTDYAIASVSSFIEGTHLTTADIKTDGEPTIVNLVEEARKKLNKSIKLEEKRGNLKDSQSMGAIEAPIRWFQAKVRTYKFDLEKRFGMKITADAPIWCWLTRYVSWPTSTYRPRADGGTSHQAAYGVTYNGEILPFGETALFKTPISHTRQIATASLKRKGESSFVKGIWIGKHKESDDHLFLTPAGWHRARTRRRLEPALRADDQLMKAVKALPWDARSAKPCELLPRIQRPMPTIVLTAAEQKTKTEAQEAAREATPPQGAPEQGARPAAAASAEPSSAPAGPGAGAAAAARPEEKSTTDADAPMTPRGLIRPADAEDFGAPGKRAKHVDAISLDDPIDYSILDRMGTDCYVTVGGLEPAVELKGKREALEVLAHYGAHRDIPRSESGEFKKIRARWEPQTRGGICKWRYVAQEFKWMEQRDDVFAASLSAQTSRLVDFVSIKEENHGTFIADCVKAYYQADQTEKVCVGPPAEYLAILAEMGKPTDIVWALDKMLPGQRVAGAGWVDKAAKTLKGEGFDRSECQPQFYDHREKEILIEVHMGDFHGEGPSGNLDGIIKRLRGVFDLKATDVIMQGRYSHLKRDRLRLMNGNIMLRPNVKHIDDLIYAMGMETAKPAKVPSLTEEDPTWSPELDEIERASFRAGVGIALYISPDRADIQRGVQLLTRNLSQPTEFDRKRLAKLVTYLKGAKTFGVLLEKPTGSKPGEVKLQLFTDADFATCTETRRAMTCGITKLDGEAEFYGATSVARDGKLAKNMPEWLGYKVTWELGIDSSAAKAMINREGVGKVKHLDVRALWIQQGRKVDGLNIKKESELAGIVDCSEMDQRKELEACSVTTSAWAKQGLLATLLAQGALLGCWSRAKWATMKSSTKLNLVEHTNTPNRSKELINKVRRATGENELAAYGKVNEVMCLGEAPGGARRATVARAREAAHALPSVFGSAGRGAQRAAWAAAFAAEASAASTCHHVASLLDLVEAFERIPRHLVAAAAVRLGFDLVALRLSLAAYQLARAIGVESTFSCLLVATRGITAGSGFATVELQMLLRESVLIATFRWPLLQLFLYVDDLTITASGFSEEALAAVSRGTEFFVDMFEKCLQLTVSPTESFAVASRPRLAIRLSLMSKRRLLVPKRSVKMLGTPYAGGRARSAGVLRGRLKEFKARIPRIHALRRQRIDVTKVVKAIGSPSMLHGVDCRRNVDVGFAVLDAGGSCLDPAFAAHATPLRHWGMAYWQGWAPAAELDAVFELSRDRLVNVLASGRSPWSAVAGPVAGVIATAWRLGWTCTSPRRFTDDIGEPVDFLPLSPAMVAAAVHRSVDPQVRCDSFSVTKFFVTIFGHAQ